MGLREEKKRRTRGEILAAAEDAFRARGFEGTRVRDIAALLHLSEQTVFNYFPSKEALVDALALDWFRRLAEHAERMRAQPADRPPRLDDFLAGVRALLRAIADDRAYMQLVFTRAPMLRDAGRREVPEFEKNLAVLGRTFGELQRSGALRTDVSAQEIAAYYVTLFNATVTRWLCDPSADAEELVRRVERALGVLFRGLRPDTTDPGGRA